MTKLFWMTAAIFLPLAANAEDPGAPTPANIDKAAVHAERRANGVQAARSPEPGEGTPIPDAVSKIPQDERKAVGAARRAELTREGEAGELREPGEAGEANGGNTEAKVKIPRAERRAAGAARRAELSRENKAGQLSEPGESYPGR